MKNKLTKPILPLFLISATLLISFSINASVKLKTTSTNTINLIKSEDSLRNEMFVIVGTYLEEENAVKHVLSIKKEIESAGYFLNTIKNTYYVYAFKSKNKQITLDRLFELRNKAAFKDVWFYKHRVNSVSSQPIATVSEKASNNNSNSGDQDVLYTKGSNTEESVDRLDQTALTNQKEEDIPVLKAATNITPVLPEEDQGALEASNKTLVIPENITLKAPEVDKEDTHLIEKSPNLDAVDRLHTAKSGDVIIFNNLIFHRNAAILHRSSEQDLFALLTYLNDNPASRIKIHGHTNGEFRGEIIKMGKRGKDYFVTSSKNEYIMGDEVLLSMERAKIIKRYLAEKGIVEERLEIGGWGGQKSVYPANSEKAGLNSRVEIEIL